MRKILPTAVHSAEQSHDQGSRYTLILQHYASIAEELLWTSNRLTRLCSALSMTPSEVAAVIRVTPGFLEGCRRANKFPPTIELHLTMMERVVFPSTNGPLFPPI